MGVVVDNRDPFQLPLLFKSSVSSCEFQKSSAGSLQPGPGLHCHCNCSKGIVYIMLPLDSKTDPLLFLSFYIKIKRRPCIFIIHNRVKAVIIFLQISECNNLSGRTGRQLPPVLYGPVHDNGSVLRYFLNKLPERTADIIDIFEEIKMVFFYIKYNCHGRIK